MKITVSVLQMCVSVVSPWENLEKGEKGIAEAARRGSDLVCLPEMWTTGFNWNENRRIAEEHERLIDYVAGMAREHGVWVNGSTLSLNRRGQVSNASILFSPNGDRAGVYRKTHLFSLLGEDKHMTPGRRLCAVDAPWGRTGLSICYDIRFPELFRTYALKGAKVVLCPAAFPYPRLEHWKILVRARAIENQMFLIATNRVGSEDFGPEGVVTYFGSSTIVDPWGEVVLEANETDETLLTAEIDTDRVDEIRSRMKVLDDRRPELYELG